MRHTENIAFFIVPLFVVRVYSILLNHTTAAVPYLSITHARGFLSDAMVGFALYLLLDALPYRRALWYALWGLLTALAALNVEHISANGSNADFSFIGLAMSREFIGGSVLTLRNLQHVLVCSGAAALALYGAGGRARVRRMFPSYAAFAAVAAVTLALPVSTAYPRWTQANLLEQNARELIVGGRAGRLPLPKASEIPGRFYESDLSGVPVVKYPATKQNVLLILVEGIGHDAGMSEELMPNLYGISRDNLSYGNFIGLQHQTNRGLYAVLCGDYPNMLSKEAKSDFVGSFGSQRACLPEALRKHGYDTVFMQSARLGFMRKDLFTKNIGFDSSSDCTSDSQPLLGTKWGVDDMTLYKNAFLKVKELSRQGRPWFMTLLTVSTHHPYLIPGKPSATKEEALAFADRAVGDFIRTLELSGLLKDTLVVITTDEASLTKDKGSKFGLERNHAYLAAITPDRGGPADIGGTFSQLDIAISILDYLGLDAGGFAGRSIFREYDAGGRDLIFANVYSSLIFGLSGNKELYVCKDLQNCDAYGIGGGGLFDGELVPMDKDPAFFADFTDALLLNDWDSETFKIDYVYRETGREYSGINILLGDHKIGTKEGDRIKWTLSIKTEADIKVVCYAKALDHSNAPKLIVFNDTRNVAAGSRLDFKYDLTVPVDTKSVWTTFEVIAPEHVTYKVEELSIKKENPAGP